MKPIDTGNLRFGRASWGQSICFSGMVILGICVSDREDAYIIRKEWLFGTEMHVLIYPEGCRNKE